MASGRGSNSLLKWLHGNEPRDLSRRQIVAATVRPLAHRATSNDIAEPVELAVGVDSAGEVRLSLQHSGSPAPPVVVRDTIAADLPEIFRIRTEPSVRCHQYALGEEDTLDVWQRRLDGDNVVGVFTIRHSTILRDQRVIGHIIQSFYEIAEARYVSCGWNLDPAYWGHGFMSAALRQRFGTLFREEQVRHIFADCFSSNHRCRRLVTRLGFVQQKIPLHDRLRLIYTTGCWRWLLRFRLDAKLNQQT